MREIQKLTGFLNFLCRAIVPGRAFTRRLYALTSPKLKPHHHVKLTLETRYDMDMWISFLKHPTIHSRPFIDMTGIASAIDLDFYTDSSGSEKLGMGGICGSSWMMQKWDENFIKKFRPSIEYLELFAVCAAVLAWIPRFANMRIAIFCDNKSVVDIINSTSSKCKRSMILVRLIVMKCLTNNVRIFAKHVKGIHNVKSDHLSRLRFGEFVKVSGGYDKIDSQQTAISDRIWPMEKVWNINNYFKSQF